MAGWQYAFIQKNACAKNFVCLFKIFFYFCSMNNYIKEHYGYIINFLRNNYLNVLWG